MVEAVDAATEGEVGIRWGMFYSNRLCGETLGLGGEGVVRVSLVHYNSCEFFPSSYLMQHPWLLGLER